jgi:HSP20 family protein
MANRAIGPWTGGRGLSPFDLRDPFGPFRREMDRLFDDFFTPAEGRSFAPSGVAQNLWPRIDVEETDQAYLITAEVPGLDEKNIDLNLRDNVLTISGEKREERQDKQRGAAYAERFYGQFKRTIPLDVEVDADKVDAKFRNGVLAVTLPKSQKPEAKARRIEVKPGK